MDSPLAVMSDDEFLEAFHSCSLPKEQFSNELHFRLAWLHLHREPAAEAESRIRNYLRKYAEHHGVFARYHETITLAWIRLVATHRESSFEEFFGANESRLKLTTLHRFWSPDLLASDRARQEWVAPDLEALPAI